MGDGWAGHGGFGVGCYVVDMSKRQGFAGLAPALQ